MRKIFFSTLLFITSILILGLKFPVTFKILLAGVVIGGVYGIFHQILFGEIYTSIILATSGIICINLIGLPIILLVEYPINYSNIIIWATFLFIIEY